MDLENESVEDNEVNPESISHVDVNKIKNNGSCDNEKEKLSSGENVESNVLPADTKREGSLESGQRINSPPSKVVSPSGGLPPTKGQGLKKWRRIRRSFVKDESASVDSGKILKRGLSGSANPTRHQSLPAEIKQNSEGSVGSANMFKNAGVADGFATRGSSLDSRFAFGSPFTAGTDSDNSEDRSSKSSTAASIPKSRYDLPSVLANVREKNKVKNLSGKSLGNSVQNVQQGKGRIEGSKKARGERVKIEKENSHSSMESDSRSSNFVFMQGAFSVTNNGKQSGRMMDYDGENSDEAQASEQQFSEELQTGYNKENAADVEDLSQEDLAADLTWEFKEDKSENHLPSADRDPLVESILTLQAVQEALEKEIQKFREIGRESSTPHDDSINGGNVPSEFTYTEPEIPEPTSPDRLGSESSLEIQVFSLKQNVKVLESKLDEARAMVEAKESRVAELEATLNSSKSPKKKIGSTKELQQERCREVEAELESLIKQKIEAEVEYLTMTGTIQNLRLAAGDQITLFEDQNILAREQAQMQNKLGEAERKAVMLKNQAEEMEKIHEDMLKTEKVLKIQKRVCKVTSCFFIQLLLLVLVLWLCLLQLSPQAGVVVPT